MIVHALNTEHIKKEAERIRSKPGFNDRDLVYYDWVKDNTLRILPPYSARGLLFKCVRKHFELPPEKSVADCFETWPDLFDTCPIDEAIDKIMVQFPELDLSRQLASDQYYANVIDRDNEDAGVQIARFTPATYNWISLQIDDNRVGDISNYENGLDLAISVGTTKRKDGQKQKKYTPSILPNRCPLGTDEQISDWLGQIYDLDRVYGPPSQDKQQEIRGVAARMISFYTRKYSEGRSSDSVSRREDRILDNEPARRDIPDQVADPTPSEASVASLDSIDPKGTPACYMGNANPQPHDAGMGYKDDREDCLLCPRELECMDITARKG